MFWLLATISMIAYSVQNVLMVHHIRQMDAWSAAMYRTLSLGISMSPLLLIAGREATLGITAVLPQVILASLLGAGGLTMAFSMFHFLPIGISTAISSGIRTVLMIVLAWIFLGEVLSVPASVLITVILLATLWLGIIRQNQKEGDLKVYQLYQGIVFVTVQGLLVAGAFILFSDAARQHNPLVVSYFWEIGIGILLMLIGLLRWKFIGTPLQKISLKTFWKILLVCSPTLVGTGLFAVAVTIGPIGIVGAIGVGSIFISAVLSYWIYHEKPKRIEWFVMSLIALGIIGLRLI